MTVVAKKGESAPPPEKAVTGNRPKVDPLIGATVNGRFTISRMIARGGMGKVYEAVQSPLDRVCALKVLHPKYDGDEDPEFQRRFYLEASTASKLTHPNTVTIFDYGRDDELDIYFIAMEYVRGRTLFRILRDDGVLEEHRVAHILRQVGRSLREAHTQGVIHRDMKPANVVVAEGADERDSIKVLDFGLVKDVTGDDPEDLTQQGLFMGSPKYMAPEQILGDAVSPATDVYSLGVVAYELLTGSVPFDEGASVKTLMAHVHQAPPEMNTINPDIYLSAEMNSIIMCCLAKDPKERFESMDDLLIALTQVEGGGTVTDSLHAGPASHSSRGIGPPRDEHPSGTQLESGPTRRIDRSSVPPSHRHQSSGPPSASSMTSGPPSATESAPVSTSPFSDHPSSVPAPSFTTPNSSSPVEMKSARSSAPVYVALGVVLLMAAVALGFGLSTGDVDERSDETAVTDAPAPPAPVTATVGAPATTAEVLPGRTVKIQSSPAGASVKEGGVVVCEPTPCDAKWPKDTESDHVVEIILEGHQPRTVRISAATERVTADLEPIPKAKKPLTIPWTSPRPQPPQPAAPQPAKTSVPGYKDSPY